MKRIHVLSPGWTNPNSCAFLFPLHAFRRALKDENFDIRVHFRAGEDLADCDALLADSKFFSDGWRQDRQKTLEHIAALGAKTRLIWCDQSDSSGTLLGQVLPHVAVYAKAQLLADRREYLRPHYGARIYTDYYHRNYGVQDDSPYFEDPAAGESDLTKLRLSWNSGMMHHGFCGPYLNLLQNRARARFLLRYPGAIAAPGRVRSQDVSCRMGISYPRASIRFQREKLREILRDHIRTDKISRGAYFRELQSCRICLSPFGYGEITLKDFEVFLTGGALLKPDMSHMRTWPDFFEEDKTYATHGWDLTDVREKMEALLNDPVRCAEIAENGQKRFLEYTASPAAPERFTTHFQGLVSVS